MAATMRFEVVLIPSEEGWAVGCPALPGCWSQGGTRAEALENITIAIQEYLEVRAELLSEGEVAEVEVLI